MFSLFPAAYPKHHPSYYSDHDHAYLDRDYLHALARQRAQERREAQYRAYLETVRRQRAYQEQLARKEAVRRRSNLVFGGFDSEDESYPGLLREQHPRLYEDNVLSDMQPGRERPLEDLMQKRMGQDSPSTEAGNFMNTPHTNPNDPIPAAESRAENQTNFPKSSHGPDIRDAAARKIQAFVRTLIPRLHAVRTITAVSHKFEEIQEKFHFPSMLDFDVTSNKDVTPSLLFTSRNASLHGHEHALVKLLSDLDAVDSHGDARVRRVRKQLVKRIEFALADLDAQKKAMWEETARKASNSADGPASHSGHISEDPVELAPCEGSFEDHDMDLDTSLLDSSEEEDAVEKEVSGTPDEDMAVPSVNEEEIHLPQ